MIIYLLSQGHSILNVDLLPLPPALADRVHTLPADLTDSGQVYNAFTSHFKLTEPFREPLNLIRDAIIHLGGYARNMIVPDNETFRGNALSTYNVIEAASRLGIRKIVTASSLTVYGVSFAEGDLQYTSFPVDEDVDINPMDTYAISKVCGERVARGFARRFGNDIYVLRIGAVVAPDEYKSKTFESYVKEPERWAIHGWAYTDARDLGQMCDLAIRKDDLGFQIFNAVNNEITNHEAATSGFLKRVCPGVPVTKEIEGREAPVSNRKIRKMLGFCQDHPWQMYHE